MISNLLSKKIVYYILCSGDQVVLSGDDVVITDDTIGENATLLMPAPKDTLLLIERNYIFKMTEEE